VKNIKSKMKKPAKFTKLRRFFHFPDINVASSQPFSKGEGLKRGNIPFRTFKVLSFGEDYSRMIVF